MYLKSLILVFVLCETLNCQSIGSESNLENAINSSNVYLEKVRKELMIPAIVAGVSINGTIVWAHALGLTDVENDVVARVDSVWRMGSVSKAMTSVLMGKLIDEGLIAVEKSIHNYLKPNIFPIKKWNNKNVTITVGQVLSHTAGLHVMHWPNDMYLKLFFNNVTEQIKQFKDEPLLFEPGTKFQYSNYGFQLLGAIAEAVLNDTYENAINKMFEDFDMKLTSCERRERIIRNRCRYYVRSEDKTRIENTVIGDDLTNLEANWPSGGLISTVPDMLKLGIHLVKWSKGINDSLLAINLSAKTVNILWTPVVKTNGQPIPNTSESYAHGWYVTTLNNPIVCSKCRTSPIKTIIWHTGGMAGSNTVLVIEPINEIVLTVFTNLPADQRFGEIIFTLFTNFVN